MAKVNESIVELRGGMFKTRVLSSGKGKPVVFLHGAGGLFWDPFLDALAEHCNALLLLLRRQRFFLSEPPYAKLLAVSGYNPANPFIFRVERKDGVNHTKGQALVTKLLSQASRRQIQNTVSVSGEDLTI